MREGGGVGWGGVGWVGWVGWGGVGGVGWGGINEKISLPWCGLRLFINDDRTEIFFKEKKEKK